MKELSLGPWPLGVDNFHAPDHKVFQPPGQGMPPARLVAASDVDLDDEGWPSSRPGVSTVLEPTAVLTGFSALGLLLIHDEDAIFQINLDVDPVTATELVSGLATDDPVQWLEFDGQIFWTTTSYAGRITAAGVPHNWGMQVPPAPTLGTTSGTLPAGLYQVTCTYTDAAGIESAAPYGSSIAMNGTSAITFDLTPNDDNATHVRIYATEADSDAFYFVKAVAVAALPTTLTDCSATLFPLETHHMRGPVPGSGLFSLNRSIWTHRGRWAFPSSDLSPHLFDPMHEVVYVSAPIRAAAGLPGGIWLATERGLFFLRGGALREMTVSRKDYEYYARGTLILGGAKLPTVESSEPVCLFVNKNSIVACTSDGRAIPVTQDRYLPGDMTEKRASFAYVERDGLRQIMVTFSATTPEVEEFVDPSGSFSLVAEDEITPILQRILDLEANQLPPGGLVGDVLTWDGNVWTSVPLE